MTRYSTFVRAWVVLMAILACFTALSHDGPEHEIEELTDRLSKEGESGDLLLQRAIEYQVLGKNAEAAKDLERALQYDTQLATVQRELSRVYFALGKTNEALRTATRALKTADEGPDHATLLIVRAEILRARREYEKALQDADEAIREYPGSVEWYLLRSQLQARLKLKKERLAGLEEGINETSSGVLEAEWVDALIDDQQHARAAKKIETELKNSRLQSSWLIRRARVNHALGKVEQAKSDLDLALTELNGRIRATSPDPSLLADRAMARELLGDKEEARKDYEQARAKGMSEEWIRERIRSLRNHDDADKD